MSSQANTGSAEAPGSQGSRLPRATVARYAAGSLATGGFATLPGLVLVYYLTDSLGVTALAAGVIVTLAKVWDVLIDPIIGGLSDRALARTGTRRTGMLIGTVGLPLSFVSMFAVPQGLGPLGASIWVLVSFVAAATFFSLFQIPYIALPAELTDGYKERTRLLTWRVVVLTIAILLFGAGGPEIRDMLPANPLLGYLVMAIVAALLLAVGLAVATSTAPRGASAVRVTTPPKVFTTVYFREGLRAFRESQPFRALLFTFMLQGLATGLMLACAQYVATWVLHSQGAVTLIFVSLIAPALIIAPVWQWIADRIGKERTYRIASVLYLLATIALIGMVVWPGNWILVPVGLAGAAYAGMQTMPMAMLPDVMSHDARSAASRSAASRSATPQSAAGNTAEGRSGVFSGVWTAGETAGMAFGTTLLALLLAASGYVESVATVSVEQSDTAVTAIALSFSLVPALLMIASLLTFNRYRLTEASLAAAFAEDTSGESRPEPTL